MLFFCDVLHQIRKMRIGFLSLTERMSLLEGEIWGLIGTSSSLRKCHAEMFFLKLQLSHKVWWQLVHSCCFLFVVKQACFRLILREVSLLLRAGFAVFFTKKLHKVLLKSEELETLLCRCVCVCVFQHYQSIPVYCRALLNGTVLTDTAFFGGGGLNENIWIRNEQWKRQPGFGWCTLCVLQAKLKATRHASAASRSAPLLCTVAAMFVLKYPLLLQAQRMMAVSVGEPA